MLALPTRAPISNTEVNKIGSANQAGFTQWIVVKTVIKSSSFLIKPNLIPKQNSNFETQLIKNICEACTQLLQVSKENEENKF